MPGTDTDVPAPPAVTDTPGMEIDTPGIDTPPGMVPDGSDDKIMHACLRINGAEVMASDGCERGKSSFEGFSLSVNARDEAEADRMFAALADGGKVQMPLGKTFFAKRFGAVADRFGVGWMVIVEA